MGHTPDTGAGPADRLQVVAAVEGATFPATRDELVAYARRNDAYETVLETLAGLAVGPYADPASVGDAVGGDVAPSGRGSGPRGLSSAGDDRESHAAPLSPPD
jgi:hypothetical protein